MKTMIATGRTQNGRMTITTAPFVPYGTYAAHAVALWSDLHTATAIIESVKPFLEPGARVELDKHIEQFAETCEAFREVWSRDDGK